MLSVFLELVQRWGVCTVWVYPYEDRYPLHRCKLDECYQIGDDSDTLKPYLDMEALVKVAKDNDVDAIHPGYRFFLRSCSSS